MVNLYVEVNLEVQGKTILESFDVQSSSIVSMPVEKLVEVMFKYGGLEHIDGFTLQVHKKE